jgi:hypothetical protein
MVDQPITPYLQPTLPIVSAPQAYRLVPTATDDTLRH